MGTNLSISSIALGVFELLNELFIAAASGTIGLTILIHHGIKAHQLLRTVFITTITTASLIYAYQSPEFTTPGDTKVVFITGCDSGLGFSLASHAHELGFTVFAGCLNLESRGARELENTFGDKMYRVHLDLTQMTTIKEAVDTVERFLIVNTAHKLWAVINNAGVMVFGEFEWQTDKLVQHQLEVNLAGTFRFTRAFCPLLRRNRGRIITVTSHCANATLPGLAVYGATKAALSAWSDGLRVELSKFGIKVIKFIPGSFTMQSNIMANQIEHSYEMYSDFTEEQKQFYNNYFKRYNSYLSFLSGEKLAQKIDDPHMYLVFERALLAISPNATYVNEPLSYSIYHCIFKYSPVFVRDYFITLFMRMPPYHPPKINVQRVAH